MIQKTVAASLQEGKELIDGKQYEAALELFNELAKDFPDSPIVCYYIGLSALRLGRAADALGIFTRGEELLKRFVFRDEGERPKWQTTFTHYRAKAYFDLKDYKKAAEVSIRLADERMFA